MKRCSLPCFDDDDEHTGSETLTIDKKFPFFEWLDASAQRPGTRCCFFLSLFLSLLNHLYSYCHHQPHIPTSENRRISFSRFFIACIEVLIERRRVVVDGTGIDSDVVGKGESDGGKRIFRLDIDDVDDEDGTDFDRLCKSI
jgi:hypothetical protein